MPQYVLQLESICLPLLLKLVIRLLPKRPDLAQINFQPQSVIHTDCAGVVQPATSSANEAELEEKKVLWIPKHLAVQLVPQAVE